MKPKILEIHDDLRMCPLDMLWLVNSFGDGTDTDFSNKLISVLLHSEIPLYYVDQRFDSDTLFSEYRLTEAENVNAYMQVNCAEIEDSEATMRPTCAEYFADSISTASSLSSAAVPFWFGASTTVGFECDLSDVSRSEEKIASLFVKLTDVKSKCQLQGMAGFHWPIHYPIISHHRFVIHRIENGLWMRTKLNRPESVATPADHKDELFRSRVACVLKVLRKQKYVLSSGVWNPASGKFPGSSKIYEWVRNDPSFCIHGHAGRGAIAESTFNQLWKERLRITIHKLIGFPCSSR